MAKNDEKDKVGYIEPNFDGTDNLDEIMDTQAEERTAKRLKEQKKAIDGIGKTEKTKVPGIVKRKTTDGYVYDATYYNGKETYFDEKTGTYKERIDRPKKTFSNFRAAQTWLEDEKGKRAHAVALKKSVVVKTYKITEVFPIYREYCVKIGKSDNYLKDYDRHVKRYLKYFVGANNKDVTAMDAGDFTDYLTHEFTVKGYAYKTLQKLKSSLSMVWDFMVERGSTYNVFVNVVKAAKIHAPESEYQANMLDYKQIGELIKEACDMYDPTFLYLTVMSMTQGLRRGELCGLMWGDIDFETNRVIIQHNRIQRLKGAKLPKMNKKRVIELHKAGRAIIDLYKEWQEKQLGRKVKNNEFVMQWEVNIRNNYIPSVGKISRRWKEIYNRINKLREKAGKEKIPYGRLHDGRHIYLTNMVHGVRKEDGTVIPSVNLFQAYLSAGHTLPKALQNVSTQSYIEDVDARWDVTRFWNDLLEVDVADLWRTMQEIRNIDWETMTELQRLEYQQRREKELAKALKEHRDYFEEDEELLMTYSDDGDFINIGEEEDEEDDED